MGCSHLLAITSNAAVNTRCKFLCDHVFSCLLGVHLGVGSLTLMVAVHSATQGTARGCQLPHLPCRPAVPCGLRGFLPDAAGVTSGVFNWTTRSLRSRNCFILFFISHIFYVCMCILLCNCYTSLLRASVSSFVEGGDYNP